MIPWYWIALAGGVVMLMLDVALLMLQSGKARRFQGRVYVGLMTAILMYLLG